MFTEILDNNVGAHAETDGNEHVIWVLAGHLIHHKPKLIRASCSQPQNILKHDTENALRNLNNSSIVFAKPCLYDI